MNTPHHNSPADRLRSWWSAPARSGLQRLIAPYEYRHLRGFGITRIAGGGFAVAANLICFTYGAYAWAAFFLVLGALNLAGGAWYLRISPEVSR